ncbi:MAG: hypothetical protein JWO19_5147 [Bryobacterales bacterium]|nr:hypothetical protein [Bryobacterales bacterium]
MRTATFDTTIHWVIPVVIAVVFILLCSLIKEPARKKFMAILIGGAGSAYLSGGGFGPWEMAFSTVLVICAYNGLRSYRFIGIGWLLHTGWDILHHLYGNPLLPFDPTSSLGCAICDPVIAAWCFAGAPSLFEVVRGKRIRQTLRTAL